MTIYNLCGNCLGKRRDNHNKNGSITVEGAIILPPFIIGMLLLIRILPAIAAAENAVFAMSDELMKADARAAVISEALSLPAATVRRVEKENAILDYVNIREYSYRHSAGNMGDLISIKLGLITGDKNPLGNISRLELDVAMRSRTLTGHAGIIDGNSDQFGENEEYDRVYVFPKSGEKFHNSSCPFLNPSCQMVYLTEGIRSTYGACPNCHSGKASLGAPVFCFFNDGTDYHLGSCSSVTKYYVEMDRKEAEAKGYGPCNTCGG